MQNVMRRSLERLVLLTVVAVALGYGVGLASARFAVSEAGLLGLVAAGLGLALRRGRTRQARARMWAMLACGSWALLAVLVHADRLAYVGPVLAALVLAVLNRPRRRRSRGLLGPPGGVNRVSQPSSGDG
jgi:hypothetical protein